MPLYQSLCLTVRLFSAIFKPTGLRRSVMCLPFALLFFGAVFSQNSPKTFNTQNWWQPAGPPFSPEVKPDGSITFRLKGKDANQVNLLFGEWDIKPQPLQKDSAGVWGITIAPVEPGIYGYSFEVDGVRMPDMANPAAKRGTEIYGSVVEVHGAQPRFDQWQDVPHGTLHTVRYQSTPLKRMGSMIVYLPPGYDANPAKKYPLLVLRHGGGDNETGWTQESGRADVILENLIAQNKAVPMIIVMPYGLTDGSWAGGSNKQGMEALEQEMLLDILPCMEQHYRLLPGRENRAIAGLSMGGGQAWIMGLRHLSVFAWIGQFSSGLLCDEKFDINERVPDVYADAAKLNSQLRLLWTGCGKSDPRYPGHLQMIKNLQKARIKHTVYDVAGGHEWRVWRDELHAFLQQLFK